MIPEELNTEQGETIAANDSIVEVNQNLDVITEVGEVVEKVEAIKRLNPLKRIFGLTTEEGGDEVTRLDLIRAAANDNNLPIMEKDIVKKAA